MRVPTVLAAAAIAFLGAASASAITLFSSPTPAYQAATIALPGTVSGPITDGIVTVELSYDEFVGGLYDTDDNDNGFRFDRPFTSFGLVGRAENDGSVSTAFYYNGDTLLGALSQSITGGRSAFFGVTDALITSIFVETDNGQIQVGDLRYAIEPAGVPEPASWILMLAGLGLIGGALQHRATAVTA